MSVSHDRTLKIWSVLSHDEVFFTDHNSPFTCLAHFNNMTVTGDLDGFLTFWQWQQKTPASLQNIDESSIRTVALSEDSKKIAAGTINGTLVILDSDTHVILSKVLLGACVTSLAFNLQDSSQVMAGTRDNDIFKIKLAYNINATSEAFKTIHGIDEVSCMEFQSASNFAIGMRNGLVRTVNENTSNDFLMLNTPISVTINATSNEKSMRVAACSGNSYCLARIVSGKDVQSLETKLDDDVLTIVFYKDTAFNVMKNGIVFVIRFTPDTEKTLCKLDTEMRPLDGFCLNEGPGIILTSSGCEFALWRFTDSRDLIKLGSNSLNDCIVSMLFIEEEKLFVVATR